MLNNGVTGIWECSSWSGSISAKPRSALLCNANATPDQVKFDPGVRSKVWLFLSLFRSMIINIIFIYRLISTTQGLTGYHTTIKIGWQNSWFQGQKRTTNTCLPLLDSVSINSCKEEQSLLYLRWSPLSLFLSWSWLFWFWSFSWFLSFLSLSWSCSCLSFGLGFFRLGYDLVVPFKSWS